MIGYGVYWKTQIIGLAKAFPDEDPTVLKLLGVFPTKADAERFVSRKVWCHLSTDTFFGDYSQIMPSDIVVKETAIGDL